MTTIASFKNLANIIHIIRHSKAKALQPIQCSTKFYNGLVTSEGAISDGVDCGFLFGVLTIFHNLHLFLMIMVRFQMVIISYKVFCNLMSSKCVECCLTIKLDMTWEIYTEITLLYYFCKKK